MSQKGSIIAHIRAKPPSIAVITQAHIVGLNDRSGARMLVIDQDTKGPQGKIPVELNVAFYQVLKIEFADGTGNSWEEEFDDTLIEQGEAIDTIQECLSELEEKLGSGIAGPARVEICWRYGKSPHVLQRSHGVIVSCFPPAGSFGDYTVNARSWMGKNKLSSASTPIFQQYCQILSVSAYGPSNPNPFSYKSFKGEDCSTTAYAEVNRLFSMLTPTEVKVIEKWEYPVGQVTSSAWGGGGNSSVYGHNYGTPYSYTTTPPKPAWYRKAGNEDCISAWQNIQQAQKEGRTLLSLQAVEVACEKKDPEPIPIRTACFCNSPKCYECNPEACYIC